MADLNERMGVAPPLGGLQDGLDPGLPDSLYHPVFWPDLENIRVALGTLEPRYGMSLWRTIGGTGNVRFLGSLFSKAGKRYRLAAQGGLLYDWEEDGGDVAFHPVSGGTGLADHRLQGVQIGDNFYFTDRAGVLRKYHLAAASTVALVQQPAKPVAAPSVRLTNYGILEAWTGGGGVAPFGWTQSNAAAFDVIDAMSTDQAVGGGNTVKIRIRTTAAMGESIADNVPGELVPSHTIGFYLNATANDVRISFQAGLNNAGGVNAGGAGFPISPPSINNWFIFFCQIADLGSINFKQWHCNSSPDVSSLLVGPLYLPGYLQGKYRYRISNYISATNSEGSLSDPSSVIDASIIGVNYHNETDPALKRAGVVTWASDDAGAVTDRVRIYRSGGVPALTVDGSGREIWILVGEVADRATTVAGGGTAAGASTMTVTSATGFAVGNWVTINRGQATEDFRRILSIAGNVLTFADPLQSAHAAAQPVQIAFLDNVANEALDPTNQISLERNDPPTAIQWLDRSPDGRLWAFRFTDRNAGVAVSNKPTPDRPLDYEVFPDGVDPLTRQDPLQGWRFDLGGAEAGEEIMWGGFYNAVPTILTKTGVWQVRAYSQSDWGPTAVVKVLDNLGCLEGNTVTLVNGRLHWVTDGPRVVRWDGQGAPDIVSTSKVNVRLERAPTASYPLWFGQAHAKRDGNYFCLWVVPPGGSTATLSLQLNVDTGAWEPIVYYAAGSVPLPWTLAHVPSVGADVRNLYAAHPTSGQLFFLDDPAAVQDVAVPIKIRATTKKLRVEATCKIERFFIRLLGVPADSVTVTVAAGGSEYGEISEAYPLPVTGTDEIERHQRCHFSLKGRWYQFTVTGDVSHRPAIRDLSFIYQPIRETAISPPPGTH